MSVIKSRFPDVDIPSNISLADFVFEHFDKYGDSEALVDAASGRSYTFAQVRGLSRRIGSALTRKGFKKGDVFAIYSPNLPEYLLTFYGVVSIGGIVTTTNPLYTTDELAKQLEHAGASYVVTVPPFAPKALKAKDKVDKIKDVRFGEAEGCKPFASLLQDDGGAFPQDLVINDDDVAVLPYSSGTTGLPKGVQLMHKNLVSVVMQTLSPNFSQEGKPGKTVLGLLPMYHIFGMVGGAVYLRQGYKIAIMMKFEPGIFLKTLQDYKVYHADLVPPLVIFLCKNPVVDKFDLSALHDVSVGAAPLGAELTGALLKKFPNLVTLQQGYGLTETSPSVTITPVTDKELVHGSAGCVVPNTEIKIVDTQTGEPLPANSNGELLVRGPQVMKGYLNNPEATAATIDKEGFLHTGDLAYYREDGYIFIVDRLKELIKYKGNQVAPAELEALLLTHPSVADAAVIGIPDEEAGELPKAFVVKKGDAEITEEELTKFVAEKVAPTKKLRGGVEFVSSIPKNPSGKILRRQLKEQAIKKLQEK
ncbi:uncharacterized protein [Amphiura filiformis]|uniref:uncharacterized protein n=1 Tax=Amphiura filiformis TaxID=82378 RepID=UPI003B21FF34